MIEISRLLKYDMNLLICLYVLLQERNVKRTASKLYLSQSAVSKQLTKLRQVFDDPLFERQSKGLLPTPKALALEPKLEAILLHIDQLSAPEQFDPANSNRLFTFDLVETAYSMVFEHVFPTMLESAPHITIENRDWNEASIHRLQKREVDFGIGIFEWDKRATAHIESLPDSLRYAELLQDTTACVMRKGHPALQEAWNLETYLKYRHIQVMTGGIARWLLHEVLDQQRLTLDYAVNMSNIASAVRLCENSDLILSYPSKCLQEFADNPNIELKPLPLDLSAGGLFLIWNKQLDNDPSHKWLRELIVKQSYV
ncbi:LysR substrate-binding domain-containing protein [Photobacterium aphoticum]|uniref:Transcriptional regulator n=1 Tax=Photobacterium aphoticum TaxID=754436 RepID=A0A0J1GND5_9GAMM|nr:LysR substrate-binding domain-containing protein [Photobacterium aphoticum]KLV01253.1 transcriptional regulator [Photobacterium aphoticum]PSU56314.1 LysR family transcriptional regulator [Photobacterium aphoticum]GHA50166.1 LysR family transcriptional regulator [Photobacterium aphoticum]